MLQDHHGHGVFPRNLHLEDLARPIAELDLGKTDLSLP